MGQFGAGDGEAGGVRARCDDEFVIRVEASGRGADRLGGAVDADDALAGLEAEGFVLPHRGAAEGEVDAAVREGFAQRDAVVGEVGFLGEDGDVPAVEAAGMHRIGEPVGCGAAAGDDDAARSRGELCALVLGA